MERVFKIFPDLLTPSLREFKNALLECATELPFCNTYQHMQAILDQTFELRLNLPGAKVFVICNSAENLKIPVYIRDAFVEYLERSKEICVTEEYRLLSITNSDPQFKVLAALQKLGAAVCIPLNGGNKLIGFFVLGTKEKGANYTEEEIQEFRKLRRPLQISLINILLQSDWAEERDLLKAAVQEKTKSLQILVKQQSDFMAVAAHELRTPLSIATFKLQEILETVPKNPVSTEFQVEVKAVYTALTHMKRLTQRLFEVQQYELGKMELQSKQLDVSAFLQEIWTEFRLLMAEKKIDFILQNSQSFGGHIKFDEDKIRQVLHNLLNNALKFTPNGGQVVLGGIGTAKSIQIFVRDNGPGITDMEKKKIFEKFQTIKPTMSTGIGLGLYLCEQITTLHRGKIWVEESPTGGATFFIELPRS